MHSSVLLLGAIRHGMFSEQKVQSSRVIPHSPTKSGLEAAGAAWDSNKCRQHHSLCSDASATRAPMKRWFSYARQLA